MEKEYDFYGGKKIIMDDRFFKLTTDTVLLSSFARAEAGERGIDLGCGVGCLGLLCELKNPGVTVDGVEITPGAAALARKNYENCGAAGVIITGDVASFSQTGVYDLAVMNPPYFSGGGGKKSLSPEMAAARHADASLFFAAAARCLKKEGRLYYCVRASLKKAFEETALFCGFHTVRIREVRERENAAPSTSLCEAGFEKRDVIYEAPLVLRDGGGYTKEYKDIYGIR